MEKAGISKHRTRKRSCGKDHRATPGAGILRVDCGRPRRSSGSLVDFRGVPGGLAAGAAQVEPPSPQPSVDRLSVTFAEKSDCSDSSVKVNVFDPGSPPSQIQEMDKVRFCRSRAESDGENEAEDDYSASVSVIMQRRESMRRASSKKRKRRSSSPFSGNNGDGLLEGRRRSSVYTNSSGETAISIEDSTAQEQIFENIRLHKEVLSNVKLQPWGMRRKIKLVQQAKAYVKRHEGELQERLAMSKSTKDILARFNIWLIKKLQYLRRELANTMTLLIPWELRIKEIESHFGSAVASYFTFLRWMFWVNLVITIILACFVAIPEMLTADVKNAGERKEMLPEEKLTAANLATLWDFEGILKYSPIFYGYYTNKDGPGTGYRLPFAYFMTGLAVYVYSFVATLRRMAENSRMSKLSEKDDECIFTWKLFTGWDYMIGNAETAHNRVASLVLGFKEALLEETERKRIEKNWKIICMRMLVNLLVIGLLVFSAYVVFIVVERSTEPEADDTWWRQNEITVSLSIISLIFPIFFELLGFLEGYHPRKSLRIQLARIMVLNLLNLYTLIFSQFWKISKMAVELQSLKGNYSATFGDSTSISPSGNVTPNCYYIALNCSNPGTISDDSKLTFEIANAKTMLPLLNGTDLFNESSGGFSSTLLDRLPGVAPEPGLSTRTVSDTATSSSFEAEDTPAEGTRSTSAFPNLFTVLYGSVFESMLANITGVWNDGANLTDGTRATEFLPFNSTDVEARKTEAEGNPPREVMLLRNLSVAAADNYSSSGRSVCYERRCESAQSEEARTKILTGSEMTGSMFDMETRRKLRRLCWETMFGQELVKLTVMDLVLTILSVMLLDFFRALFVRLMNNCWCWDLEKKFPQYGDFKIAENILHLVNNQGMVWMGMFFSPGLPAINLIKLVIMMYLRSWAVLTCNVPHEVVFRASRSNNFYLALLLTMLFLCVLPVGFAIVWIEPSWHCGPFSDYKRIYHLFTESLQKALPETLHKALDYVASPGIIIPLLMLLVLIIYYLVSLTNSLREANNDLKIQLRRERTEERRKMFQLVDKRARKGSKDSEMPFAKWKKLLPEVSPRPAAQTTDTEKEEKTENGIVAVDLKRDVNKKELLTKLMKRALRKSSVTSDDGAPPPEDVTDVEQHSPPFEEGARWPESVKKSESNRKSNANARKKYALQETEEERNISPTRSRSKPAKIRRKSSSSVRSMQRSSASSDWPENIPVITISKTESEESIPKEESAEVAEKKAKRPEQITEERIRVPVIGEERGEKVRRKASEERTVDVPKSAAEEVVQVALAKGFDSEREEFSNTVSDAAENSIADKEQEEKCPIATEETVSSDLDISQGSLVGEKLKNDQESKAGRADAEPLFVMQ